MVDRETRAWWRARLSRQRGMERLLLREVYWSSSKKTESDIMLRLITLLQPATGATIIYALKNMYHFVLGI